MKRIFQLVILIASVIIPMQGTQAFSDLPESHKYHFALTYLNDENVVAGYGDGTMKPDQGINRAELAKILVEGQGLLEGVDTSGLVNCFPDVKSEWFAQYICFAKDKGWVAGYPNGMFQPGQGVNKVEALKMIMNAYDEGTRTPENLEFNDVQSSDWFAPFLQRALDRNTLEERGGATYNPSQSMTRGQVGELVARIKQLKYMNDPVYSDWIRAEFQTFQLIHKLRRENGVTERLRLNPKLTKVAREHSKDMAENIGDMSHYSSDGRASWERIRAGGLEKEAQRTGENVGRGTTSTYRSVFKAVSDVHYNIFMPEPDGECNHRTTILSTCLPFNEVGIGIYVKNGTMYFTEDFISTEYSKTLVGAEYLQVPAEMQGGDYVTETDNDNYSFTKAKGCDGEKVRLDWFIEGGIFVDDSGECYLYEFANHVESNFYAGKIDDIAKYGALTFFYNSNIYDGITTIQFDEGYINVSAYTIHGWEITSHAYPADFNFGDTTVMTIKNNKTGQELSLLLDFREDGWVRVTKM